MISGCAILLNEEELVQYMLDSFVAIVDQLHELSLVDNGSTDDTLDIVASYKGRLPIVIQYAPDLRSHGALRNLALTKCTAPWIFYLDADESADQAFVDWIRHPDQWPDADIYDFYKYSTIADCYHFTWQGGGPCTRMFRNTPGVTFSQLIHTYPEGAGFGRKAMIGNENAGPLLFDGTHCKSVEAHWAKSYRYQWAMREKVEAIGGPTEYADRLATALSNGSVRELPDDIKKRIFTGRGVVR